MNKQKEQYIWFNGKIIRWEDSLVHTMTHSLHYGGSVYEGLRAYNGKIFKLIEHSIRLIKSAKLVCLPVHYSLEQIIQASKDIVDKNNLKNAYIRPLIWRGPESLSIYNKNLKSNLLIFAQESNPPFRQEMKLMVSPWKKIAEDAIPAQSKTSAHYTIPLVSQKLAIDQGYDDCLMLDRFDNIAECSVSNVFFAKDNELVTPIADRFLNGITRQTVIELAREIGMKVRELRLDLEDMDQYNTCFSTGTSVEIRGVYEINTKDRCFKFPNNKLVKILQDKYAKLVGKQL